MRNPSLLSLLLLSLPVAGFSQATDAALIDRHETETIAHYPELMFVHTDKESYVSGELVWFRLYCLSGITHQPTGLSQLAYVDLVDHDNKVIQSAVVTLDDSSSSGSLALPLRLPGGSYELRAYTRWMLNQPSSIFRKSVSITNTLLESAPVAESAVRADAQVLPESGSLLGGFENRIGLFYQENGHGYPATGVILAGSDTVKRFTLPANGHGYADFNAQAGTIYQVMFTGSGGRTSKASVEAEQDGYLIQPRWTGAGWQVKVLSRRKAVGKVNLLVSAGPEVVTAIPLQLKNTFASTDLITGRDEAQVLTLTLYEGTIPMAERLVFIPGPDSAVHIIDGLPAASAGRRAVAIPAQTGGHTTNLSLSVYLADSLGGNAQHITDYFNLGRYLNGPLEDPAQYRGQDAETLGKIDALMLTQGWRKVETDPVKEAFIPEYGGQIVDFDVVNDANLSPAANIDFVVSVPDKPFKLQTAQTNGKGHAQMVIPGLSGLSQFYLSTPTKSGLKWRVTPTPRPMPEFPMALTGAVSAPNSQRGLEERSIAMQAQQVFHGDAINAAYTYLPTDTTAFYGAGKVRYDLDQYVRFRTMEEVLREYVREINVGVGGNELHMRLWDEVRRDVNEKNVLVMWNGLPVANTSRIFNEDPLKVQYIDVIPRRYYVNGIAYQALANFIGKQTDDLPETFTQEQAVFMLQGIHPRRHFFSPAYDNDAARASSLPDFRTTLIWEPHYDASKPFRFYTGDRTGKFIAVVQGMVNGKAVYEEKEMMVQ